MAKDGMSHSLYFRQKGNSVTVTKERVMSQMDLLGDVKSLTPLHFLGLWPIGRRNALLIGTSADSATYTTTLLQHLTSAYI